MYTPGYGRNTLCTPRGYGGYPCIYTRGYGGIPCICTPGVWERYTLVVYTLLYTPGYTMVHPTPPGHARCYPGVRAVRGDEALGSNLENSLGNEAQRASWSSFLSGLVGEDAQSPSGLPGKNG